MKTKLLKKLRSRFYVLERNGKYRLFDSEEENGQPTYYSSASKYMSKDKVIKKRRKKILESLENYLEYKNKLTVPNKPNICDIFKTKNIMKTSEIIFTLIVTAVIVTIIILTPPNYR